MVAGNAKLTIELCELFQLYGDSLDLRFVISNDSTWHVEVYGKPSDLRRSGVLVRLGPSQLTQLQQALDEVKRLMGQHSVKDPWQPKSKASEGPALPETKALSKPDDELLSKLERLGNLHKQGLLSDDEFEQLKSRLF